MHQLVDIQSDTQVFESLDNNKKDTQEDKLEEMHVDKKEDKSACSMLDSEDMLAMKLQLALKATTSPVYLDLQQAYSNIQFHYYNDV